MRPTHVSNRSGSIVFFWLANAVTDGKSGYVIALAYGLSVAECWKASKQLKQKTHSCEIKVKTSAPILTT